MKGIETKKVLITGGASGIGKLMALEWAKKGATVLVVDIQKEAAEETIALIKSQGGKGYAFTADLSELESMKKLKSDVLALGIDIDILVNNAGVVFGGEFERLSLEKHLMTYYVNIKAPVSMTHLFFDSLRKAKCAHIVNIASASGFIGLPYGTSYASSKWAMIGFSESLRLELFERGIKNIHVTTVCPSYISTGMFSGVKAPLMLPWLSPEAIVKKIIEGTEKKKPFVKEPFVVKWVDFLKGILPLSVFNYVNKLLGVSTSMTHWKGRAE